MCVYVILFSYLYFCHRKSFSCSILLKVKGKKICICFWDLHSFTGLVHRLCIHIPRSTLKCGQQKLNFACILLLQSRISFQNKDTLKTLSWTNFLYNSFFNLSRMPLIIYRLIQLVRILIDFLTFCYWAFDCVGLKFGSFTHTYTKSTVRCFGWDIVKWAY